MTELANIFEPTREAPKGPDLYVSVRPPRPVEGVPTRVAVPLLLPHEGALVRRADPHGDGEQVTLGIPPGLAAGTTLRLRGAGGVCTAPDGQAGDLYITIDGYAGTGSPSSGARTHTLLTVGVLAAALVTAWFASRPW